jgi:hypothetical protein
VDVRRFLVLLFAAVIVGCGSPHRVSSPASLAPSPSGGPLSFYADESITFGYPAAWRFAGGGYQGLHDRIVTYLSTQPLQPPCMSRDIPGGGFSVRCQLPVGELKSGDVLAWWTEGGLRPFGVPVPPGQPIRVDGYDARVNAVPGGLPCPVIGGDELVAGSVDFRGSIAFYSFTACAKGLAPGQLEAEVRTVLANTRFSHR